MEKGKSSDMAGTSSSSNNSKDNSGKEKKYAFYRKPSIKKKGPEVKQTKTSMKRLLIANPLLKYETEGLELPKLEQITNNEETVKTVRKLANFKQTKPSIIIGNSSDNNNEEKKSRISTSSTVSDFNNSNRRILSSTRCEIKPAIAQKKVRPDMGQKKKIEERKPLRRSISAQHIHRKNDKIKSVPQRSLSSSVINESSDNVNNCNGPLVELKHHNCSPIPEGSREPSFIFKTPTAYERRSRISTPLSASARRSLYRPTTPLPSLNELQKRLNDWLTKRGKNISSFHNLRCFHKYEPIEEENKENIEGDGHIDGGSYENLFIPQNLANNSKEEHLKLTKENIESIAKAALSDLQNLVQEGYPVKHCEIWLELIKEKYSRLVEEPEYWECKAAIEESRGDIGKAVECYKTAIVHGAEVKEVDKSLDVLLQKFSLLDINSEYMESEKMTKERARIIRDARNVFKSSIIKFAVQEKKIKSNGEKKLVATPVRRSTRLSRSAYTSTPGVKMCSSLKELDTSERSQIDFQKNNALH